LIRAWKDFISDAKVVEGTKVEGSPHKARRRRNGVWIGLRAAGKRHDVLLGKGITDELTVEGLCLLCCLQTLCIDDEEDLKVRS